MDIILYDYYNLEIKNGVSFYWFDKNRTFNLLEENYIKEGNNAIHKMNHILDGSYSIALKKMTNIEFGIRVKDEIMYKEKASKIYFKIDTKPKIIISKLDKQEFIKKEYALKKGVSISARRFWNIYWNNLHLLSFNYPENPSDDDKKQITNLNNIMMKNGITCSRCKKHFIEQNKANPIELSFNSRDDLIKWYIDIHNNVNKTNKKKILTIEEVKKIYKDFNYEEFVKKYKIDVIDLFKKRKLDILPRIINTTTRQILWKEYNVFQN